MAVRRPRPPGKAVISDTDDLILFIGNAGADLSIRIFAALGR